MDGMEFKVDGNIELVFDERVVAGSGEIIISNGTDTRTIDINDTSQVMFDGYDHVTIDPIDDLLPDSNYNIQMVSGVIVDANGHAYAGISAPDTLDFMTILPIRVWCIAILWMNSPRFRLIAISVWTLTSRLLREVVRLSSVMARIRAP